MRGTSKKRDTLAPGLRGKCREAVVAEHRIQCYLDAFDNYIKGKAEYGYVAERARKLREVNHGKALR